MKKIVKIRQQKPKTWQK